MDEKQLIDALNNDLSHEYGAIVQYLTYAAKVSGPSRPELKAFFESEIPDETAHAQFLAGKIVALGGEPATTAKPVPAADDPKSMLEAVLEAETDAHNRYAERAAQAE
ncbi:MAG: ferritin-like domain-containing protein, partial [Planctomycetota bacterium]